jgi:hypothetical protein
LVFHDQKWNKQELAKKTKKKKKKKKNNNNNSNCTEITDKVTGKTLELNNPSSILFVC